MFVPDLIIWLGIGAVCVIVYFLIGVYMLRHRQISGFRFPFVEYHSDDVPQDVKDFILSRIRDPRDYS